MSETRGLSGVLDEKIRKLMSRLLESTVRSQERLVLKDVHWCAFKRKCINFDGEFKCPSCGRLLVPVCVNLGMVGEKFYCSRNFPENCSEYGCPKYNYVHWQELENYRLTGRVK